MIVLKLDNATEQWFQISFPSKILLQPLLITALTESLAPENFRLNMTHRYNVSKLLEILVMRELVQTVHRQPYAVTVNTLMPGFGYSGLRRELEEQWGFWMMRRIFAWPTEVGSRTLVHALLAGREMHGECMMNGAVSPMSRLVRTAESKRAQERGLKGIEPET